MSVSASAKQTSNALQVQLSLPAVGQVQVSLVTMQLAAPHARPLSVVGVNTSQLGKMNTQFIVALTPGSSKGQTTVFKAYVFIRHNPPARRVVSSATEAYYYPLIAFKDDASQAPQGPKLVSIVKDLSCPVLDRSGFFGDPKDTGYVSMSLAYDSKAEAQIDSVVYAKCSTSKPAPESPLSEGDSNK